MTDLRTAAQAVLDAFARREADDDGREVIPIHAVFANIEALRQALDAPVEPVVVQVNGHVFHRDGKQFVQFEQKPPSVDALIAEAVAKEREDIAEAVSQCDPRVTPKGIAAAIRARGQK